MISIPITIAKMLLLCLLSTITTTHHPSVATNYTTSFQCHNIHIYKYYIIMRTVVLHSMPCINESFAFNLSRLLLVIAVLLIRFCKEARSACF
ncbi:hypothetical protein ES288_A12G036000v1 [Gossypium darwinii]|uniref:Secreted protein n=1 Tax=Gossypium darwinii TaxID=34276 RepID=A0A5D2E5S6_GOSDA|nr:hypothetical protein ES288_A12G036000v1 [Gossypium darwinii]